MGSDHEWLCGAVVVMLVVVVVMRGVSVLCVFMCMLG